MQAILVTPENIRQYRKDCRADFLRDNPPPTKTEFSFGHDRFMFGKVVFIPKELLGYRFSSAELHAFSH